jgi:hypothetical protein
MKYSELAKVKSRVYIAAVEEMTRYAAEAAKAELLPVEKLDALYGVERAFKKALSAAQEQREMQVSWTIGEVIHLCRDMDGACERCPLYDAEAGRCFRAKDNGIAGASSPASWDLKYSPELDGTPAGYWIERFRDTHACECCSSHGGHCDVTGDRFPGRCNCKMTEVPAEWGSIVYD